MGEYDNYNEAIFHSGNNLEEHIKFLKEEYDIVHTKNKDGYKVVAIIPFEQLDGDSEDAIYLIESLLRMLRHRMEYLTENRYKDTVKDAWMEDYDKSQTRR